MMDKVQKLVNPDCYTPSIESFRTKKEAGVSIKLVGGGCHQTELRHNSYIMYIINRGEGVIQKGQESGGLLFEERTG
jgi:hypothetical protein